MKLLLFYCTANPWLEVGKQLEQAEAASVSKIIVWRDEKRTFENGFPCAQIFTVEDLWLGKGIPADDGNHKRVSSLYYDESMHIGVEMLNRLISLRSRPSPQRKSRLFRAHLRAAYSLLQDVDYVVCPSIPHRVFDYAIYIVAQLKNVHFLTFQMTPFGSRVVPLKKIENMKMKVNVGAGEGGTDIFTSQIEKAKGAYRDAEPKYMKAHKKNDSIFSIASHLFQKLLRGIRNGEMYKFRRPNTYRITSDYVYGRAGMNWWEYALEGVASHFRLKKLKSKYKSISLSYKRPDAYILVALHYQPEETTCPSAGVFFDQSLLIESLLGLVPKGVKIIVREHPSQFRINQEGAYGRGEDFYEAIAQLSDRVIFVPLDKDPFELIENSKFVVTCTGTIGWEAAVRGKQALHFGRAWYEGMPGTKRIFDISDLEKYCQDCFVNKIKLPVLEADIEVWHQEFSKNLVHAKHYKGWISNSDISDEKSIQNLVSLISLDVNSV